jgi:ADP-ribose pyrophosphatase YjhB (NUDIX family)
MLPDDQNPFYLTQPARRSGAGSLITNHAGEILLVEPGYKPRWECPGGIVERGEDPRTACAREVFEEIGLSDRTGRLLVIAHYTDPLPRGDAIMFVYEGGVLYDPGQIVLQTSELKSFRFVHPDRLEELITERLALRLRMAIIARNTGKTFEIVNGKVIQ